MGLPGSPGINFNLLGYPPLLTSLNIHCQCFSLSLTFSVSIPSLIIFLLMIVTVFLLVCSYCQSVTLSFWCPGVSLRQLILNISIVNHHSNSELIFKFVMNQVLYQIFSCFNLIFITTFEIDTFCLSLPYR